mmetsp:Transcript_17544/g.14920  ORF Transcript_17544/g.14920 Transcript_17544/m.14920 type:complete len:212 (+) Transcript_17544:292-927(+)
MGHRETIIQWRIRNLDILVHFGSRRTHPTSYRSHLAQDLFFHSNMRSAALFCCAIAAVFFSGCTDHAAVEQAALEEQAFLAPTGRPVAVSSEESVTDFGGNSKAITCPQSPVGVYCFNYEGLMGSVTIRSKAFSVAIPSGDLVSNVAYYIDKCTDIVPDYSNPQLVAVASRLSTTTAELNKNVEISYSPLNDSFSVFYPPNSLINLTRDQC